MKRFRIEWVFVAIMLDGHFAVPPGPVHGCDVGIEEDLVEVPDDNGQRGEDGFVVVDGGSYIDPPTSKQIADGDFCPHHNAGDAHERGAPDERPVFGFFGVVEARELRLLFTHPQVVEHSSDGVEGIFRARREVPDETAAVAG